MKLYLKYLSIILKSQMQHKGSLIMLSFGQFLVSFSSFIVIYFMFYNFNSVKGFNFSEVLLCFAITLLSFSLAECFFRGFDVFSSTISNGDFDRIMVRPRNIMFQVLASKIEITRIGRFIQAIIILFYTLFTINTSWNFIKIIALLLMIFGGVILFSSFFILGASISFFTIQGLEIINILTNGSKELASYPVSIYGSGVLKFYTYIIPVALVQYYPLLYIIDKTNNLFYVLTPLLSVLFLMVSYLFWQFGIKHYKSIGS